MQVRGYLQVRIRQSDLSAPNAYDLVGGSGCANEKYGYNKFHLESASLELLTN
jgi:hypothetical protein